MEAIDLDSADYHYLARDQLSDSGSRIWSLPLGPNGRDACVEVLRRFWTVRPQDRGEGHRLPARALSRRWIRPAVWAQQYGVGR